jgi:hypothetical protein
MQNFISLFARSLGLKDSLLKNLSAALLTIVSVVVILGASSFAHATVVGFEELTDGTPVRDFYQISDGVTFDLATAIAAGLSLNELEFPPHGGNNVVYDNTGPVSIFFANPAQSVFAYFTYAMPIQLVAYDGLNNPLQVLNSSFNNNTVFSGDAGSSPNELLGFSLSSFSIAMLTIQGDAGGFSFVFDDLSFATFPLSVPEPGSLALVICASMLALMTRRYRHLWSASRWRVSVWGYSGQYAVATCTLFVTLCMPVTQASAQDQARRVPVSPAKDFRTAAATLASVNVDNVKVTPSAIPNEIASEVVIQADITGTNILPNGVSVQVIDADGKIIRSLGRIYDTGDAPDVTPGDGRYTGAFTMIEGTVGSLRLVVSAAIKNTLLRSVSKPFYINVSSDTAVSNGANDVWATNNGPDGVALYFGGSLPDGAKRLRLLRAPAMMEMGGWTTVWVLDIDPEGVPLPLYDPVDGSTGKFTYRLQVLSISDIVIKQFGDVTIPIYVGDGIASGIALARPEPNMISGISAATSANVVDPVVNTAFMSDEVYEDNTSMTSQQILDFLTEKGSFLATASLTDTYKDTDGTSFVPAIYIKQLADQYFINPQLILVTMEKEAGLVRKGSLPADPTDGYMGAKGCAHTLREQLDCGVSRMRKYLTDLDSTGKTVSGWAPGVTKKTCAGTGCSLENLDVTPANRATAALWTYTPVIGKAWGGTQLYGGASLNVSLWYPSFFRNLTHIMRWKDCGLCPQAPQISPAAGDTRGAKFVMGPFLQTPSEDASQPMSRHGLSGRLPKNSSYTVEIDCSLNTWDSYKPDLGNNSTGYWDLFLVSLSDVPHWLTGLSDPINAPVTFGGKSYGDGLPDRLAKKFTLTIPASSFGQSYLNIMFDTASLPFADTNYPSWGECMVLKIRPAEPPGTLGLVHMPW